MRTALFFECDLYLATRMTEWNWLEIDTVTKNSYTILHIHARFVVLKRQIPISIHSLTSLLFTVLVYGTIAFVAYIKFCLTLHSFTNTCIYLCTLFCTTSAILHSMTVLMAQQTSVCYRDSFCCWNMWLHFFLLKFNARFLMNIYDFWSLFS